MGECHIHPYTTQTLILVTFNWEKWCTIFDPSYLQWADLQPVFKIWGSQSQREWHLGSFDSFSATVWQKLFSCRDCFNPLCSILLQFNHRAFVFRQFELFFFLSHTLIIWVGIFLAISCCFNICSEDQPNIHDHFVLAILTSYKLIKA